MIRLKILKMFEVIRKVGRILVNFKKFCLIFFLFLNIFLKNQQAFLQAQNSPVVQSVTVGADHSDKYLKLIAGKRVGLVVNQTSVLSNPEKTHLVDAFLAQKVSISVIFAPEHGFRGNADAGEKIDNGKDEKTGIQVVSLYGKKQKPSKEDLENVDVLVFDIQDVGVRFYTYISTLQYVMEAAAAHKKMLIILDRPNPNGHYVDGPVLDKSLKSFIGMQPVPIVYGMTLGEYARMLNVEGWLDKGVRCRLKIVPCGGYSHKTFYELPIKPSPNLPNIRSIYLYPSLCFFEGTQVSVGRGTEKQFQVFGSPFLSAEKFGFSFVPQPNFGAKRPFLEGQNCQGSDFSELPIADLQAQKKIDLSYLLSAYSAFSSKDSFFLKNNNFFEKLAGTTELRAQIKAGKSETAIRKTWQPELEKFKRIRAKYLLYTDF
jgi:uncharacterized protein YbbC (DUF1343 family)